MIKRFANWITATFDMRDVFFAAGFVMLVAGLWEVSPSAALIGGGSVLLFAAFRR